MKQIDQIGWEKMCWKRGFTLLHWAAKHVSWPSMAKVYHTRTGEICATPSARGDACVAGSSGPSPSRWMNMAIRHHSPKRSKPNGVLHLRSFSCGMALTRSTATRAIARLWTMLGFDSPQLLLPWRLFREAPMRFLRAS